jgi:alkylhydroperoxidase family enzyme
VFDAAERAVLAVAIEMTENVEVSPATMASLRATLPEDRHIVEIVAVIATNNMVSRVLVALGVEPE